MQTAQVTSPIYSWCLRAGLVEPVENGDDSNVASPPEDQLEAYRGKDSCFQLE